MKQILVLNPSSKITKNIIRDVMYGCWCKGKRIGGASIPPYSLLSVASVLDRAKLNVKFLDAQAEKIPWDGISKIAKDCYAVIISTSTMTINEDAAMLGLIKEENPEILTFAFGSHPTFLPQDTLNKGNIDVCIRHEPDFITREIFNKYIGIEKGDWKETRGISFLDDDGNIVHNENYPNINPLDQLPFLKTDFLPKGIEYFNPIVMKLPYITTVTSRGCPAKCTFCTAPYFYGNKLRFRSEEGVVEEMEYYRDRGYFEVYFRDETFTVKKSRTLKICRLIKEKGLEKIPWICNARIGTVDLETLTEMKEAGCHLIKFGVESGNQEILDGVKKDIKVEEIYETFRWTNQIGIETHAHFMLGMPGETLRTLSKTIKFAREINPTTATFTITSPYPGSILYDEVKARFPEIGDGSKTDLSKLHTVGLYNSIFTELEKGILEKAIKQAFRDFYMRPSYWLKTIRRIKSFNDLRRFFLAGTNILDFSISGD